jgi:radical SAM superfamily enzyme with C-terminal helix-hairpin-helix motif
MPPDFSPETEPSTRRAASLVRVTPNGPECVAKSAGFGDYVDCLVEPARCCEFALRFGHGHLCRHPARNDIAIRTADARNQLRKTDG